MLSGILVPVVLLKENGTLEEGSSRLQLLSSMPDPLPPGGGSTASGGFRHNSRLTRMIQRTRCWLRHVHRIVASPITNRDG